MLPSKSRKRKRRRLRQRIRRLDDSIARLWRKLHRRPQDSEEAERVMRRIRIRQHRCAAAMSAFFKINTAFDADAAAESLRKADELIAKYGG